LTSESLTRLPAKLTLRAMKGNFVARLGIRLAALAGAVTIGTGTALHGLSSFGLIPVEGSPLWQTRPLAIDSTALPYSLGNYLMSGQLPPPAAVRDFQRAADDAGKVLAGSCAVELRGKMPAARWWTIAAVDTNGVAWANSGALTSGGVIVEASGEVVVRISTAPQPGNWIRPPSSGAYRLALTLHDPVETRDDPAPLPGVVQEDC
jgi:hypothetical protein